MLISELIAIDGKTLRGSSNKNDKAIHMLNAFATKQGILIAQSSVDSKTSEITALPPLLDNMAIKGAAISIDAMGYQKQIAQKMREKNADYFLALKDNQGRLYEDVRDFFKLNANHPEICKYHETLDKGHGRVEKRMCWSIAIPQWAKRWP